MPNKAYTLITGASRGIGKALAYECASRGMNLLLTARTRDLLEDLEKDLEAKFGVEVLNYAVDLLDENAPKKLLHHCKEHNAEINVLINNAGFGINGKVWKADLQDQLDSIKVNSLATVAITHTFLPMLLKQKQAYILNLGSVAAFMPIPFLNVYAATKTFNLSFSRALNAELSGTHVKVSCLCPGGTKSEFFKRAKMAIDDSHLMPAEDVAKIAIDGMLSGKEVIVPGRSNKLVQLTAKLLPHSLLLNRYSAMLKR